MNRTPFGTAPIELTRFVANFPRAHNSLWEISGQDGGQSIDLGEHTLFVFSDTLVVPLRKDPLYEYPQSAHPATSNETAIFLSNCGALFNGDTLRKGLEEMRYYVDPSGFPREIIEPTLEERAQELRFWPEHGIFIDGKVYLYYLGIQTVDHQSIWHFRKVGVGLAVFDPFTGECTRLRRDGDWCLWKPASDDTHFGVQVLREGDTVYVFGSTRDGFKYKVLLARVLASQIADPDAYEYLHSLKPEWDYDPDKACSLGESSSEYSVAYNPYLNQYAMIYVDGYTKTLLMRVAPSLIGPYSPPQKIIRIPHEPSSELIYLGFEHAKFRVDEGKRIYVTSCQPRFNPIALLEVRFK